MEQTLQDGLSEGSPSIKIYRAVAAMVNLGIKCKLCFLPVSLLILDLSAGI